MVYQLIDYNTIKTNGFEYTIPNHSRELITLLANLVGSPNYSKSPYFIKTDKKSEKGFLNFVLLDGLGNAISSTDVTEELIQESLKVLN